MKVLLANIAGSVLGLIGFWCLEYRERLERWVADEYKVGGTD